MAVPTSRAEFKAYCLRKLGAPVIEINVDDDQVEDRIDESLRYYWDYHFDGSEMTYYKHQVTGAERAGAANTVVINNGGIGYTNGQYISISGGSGANGTITTNGNGVIQSVTFTEYGSGYSNGTSVSIVAPSGAGANLSLITGDGSIQLPENILGAVRVFPIADPIVRSDDLFNIRYQIALNDLYTLTSVSMVPYYMTMEHLALVSEMLVGQQPIRYSRHKDKLYVDMDWGSINKGEFLVVEAYEVVDPNVYTDVWSDRWLQNYTTAKIKYQWGSNLTKFTGMTLPGGIQFNGQQILQDAEQEIAKMEQEMISGYSMPLIHLVG